MVRRVICQKEAARWLSQRWASGLRIQTAFGADLGMEGKKLLYYKCRFPKSHEIVSLSTGEEFQTSLI